jgi:hypothetical protein
MSHPEEEEEGGSSTALVSEPADARVGRPVEGAAK